MSYISCFVLCRQLHPHCIVSLAIFIWIKLSGWWYTYPFEKLKVSWDDDIPNIHVYIYMHIYIHMKNMKVSWDDDIPDIYIYIYIYIYGKS